VSFEEIDTISQNIGRKLSEKANRDNWNINDAKCKKMRGKAYLGYRRNGKPCILKNVFIRILIYLLTNLKKIYDVQNNRALYYYFLLLFIISTRNVRNFTYIVALRTFHSV